MLDKRYMAPNRAHPLTSVISMLKALMSGRERLCTASSSSIVLQTMKTINPLLSISNDKDLVNGSMGDPATTTTSSRPPLRARFARRVLRSSLPARTVLYVAYPKLTIMMPVRIL